MATSTGIVMLVAAWWALQRAGAAWRRTVWTEAGSLLTEVAATTGSRLRPTWTGYALTSDGGAVEISGGLDGVCTRFRNGPRRWKEPGIADRLRIEAHLTR